MNYKTLVKTPNRTWINTGLNPARVSTLLAIFGSFPGLGKDCGPVQNAKIKRLMETRDVGPFRVTGIKPALDDLEKIFAEIKEDHPDLYAMLSTAGMMCYRCVRGSTSPSNHAAGTAIDLKIAGTLSLFNALLIPSGLQTVYAYFHKYGWYWAAGYKGRTDPMHFEVSDERLKQWEQEGKI